MAASLSGSSISIRPFADPDLGAVRSVAQRDSSLVPAGELLVAELDGVVRAVLSLDTGEAVADPFAPTRHLVDLLRTRARQLTGRRPRRGRGSGARERGMPPVNSASGRPPRPAYPWTREPSPSA